MLLTNEQSIQNNVNDEFTSMNLAKAAAKLELLFTEQASALKAIRGKKIKGKQMQERQVARPGLSERL